MTEELSKYIEPIKGLSPFVQGKYIKVSTQFDPDKLEDLMKFLRNYKIDFSIYDELYPSMSDPGAYISYSYTNMQNGSKWKMTLGNHGWSGGIYEIDENTILTQLNNLFLHNKLKEIQIEGVSLFQHYKMKSEFDSKEENERLITIHSVK